MAVFSSPSEVFEALGRDPQELIGQSETEWLEFKREPYHLDDEKHRFELAKDVSAIANAGRGVIVIGVETQKEAHSHQEVASELRPVSKGVVSAKRMQDIIHEWVCPRLDAEIKCHALPNGEGELWTVHVERQQERKLPFIVAREFVGDRGPDRNLFGVYKRHVADNRPYPPSEVHQWMSHGWAARDERHVARDQSDNVQPDEILRDDFIAVGLGEGEACYYMQAKPTIPTTIRNFYPGARGVRSTADVLTRIPAIRPGGFSLPEGNPQPAGFGLRVVSPQDRTISISRAGICTTILGQTHLTWAGERFAPQGTVWINPLALVEYTLEFWRFYCSQVDGSAQRSATEWRAGMRNLGLPCPVYLPRGPLGRYPIATRASSASEDNFDLLWRQSDKGEAGQLALEVLEEVYAKFHLGESCIPWVEGDQVLEDSIRSVGP